MHWRECARISGTCRCAEAQSHKMVALDDPPKEGRDGRVSKAPRELGEMDFVRRIQLQCRGVGKGWRVPNFPDD